MPHLKTRTTSVEVDDEGFLRQPERWNDEVAAALAATAGIAELTAEHWRVVRYLRQHFLDSGLAPMLRKLCKQTGFSLKKIYELFPDGPTKGACRVAGLPNGNGCV